MKTNIEHELLEIRQDLWDNLNFVKSRAMIDMVLYREILTEIQKCNFLLKRLRKAS